MARDPPDDKTSGGPTMTIADYTNPANFPLTTRPGMSPNDQVWRDALRHDDLEAAGPKSDAEAAELAELKRKVAAWDDPQLKAELDAIPISLPGR